jgi:hypothetical protein
MTDGDLDETGMFIVPKPVKVLKAYGSQGYVCYNHKGGAGIAAMSFGKCKVCNTDISSHCGGLPSLCDNCSVKLSKCKYCMVKVKK